MLKKLISTAFLSSIVGLVSANPELGDMTLSTGQHNFFNASIAIDALPEELEDKKLKVKLGSITDFYRHDIEYNKQVSSLRFKVSRDSNGDPIIRVRSAREIKEEQLQAVVKLSVGRQKIYGIYDFQLDPNNKESHTALNLLDSDHKSVEMEKQRFIAKQVKSRQQVSSAGTDSNIYQVEKGESISGIAMKLVSEYPETDQWQEVMSRLVALNPEAFIDGDENKLLANAFLTLPGRDDFDVEVDAENFEQQADADIGNAEINTALARFHKQEYGDSDFGSTYQVVKGDNLRAITIKLLPHYPNVSSIEPVMDQIFALNPEAFIGGDASRLLAGATLNLPSPEDFNVDSIFGQEWENRYQVSEGESISVIAMKLKPDYPQARNWQEVMNHLFLLNPEAFIGGDINRLRANVSLTIPSRSNPEIEAENQELPARLIPDSSFNTDKPGDKKSKLTYRVAEGESLSVIAFKLLSEFPEYGDWYSLMETLVKLNPSVLADNDIGIIQAGTLLKLPVNDSKINESSETATHRNESAEQTKIEQPDEIIGTPYNKISNALVDRAIPENRYMVSEGYSISMVAIHLFPDFPEYDSWTELMKSLHELNPDAFVDNDINQLRPNAQLRLPVTVRH